jgi:flagellar biosynthesis protein FlhB
VPTQALATLSSWLVRRCAEQFMSSDKSEKPTSHKLVEARRKGQAPKSPDVGAAAALLSGVLCLAIGASFSLERLSALLGAAVDARF